MSENYNQNKPNIFRFNNKIKLLLLLAALLVFGAVQAYAVTSGQQIWAKRYSTTSNDSATAMAIDKNNNVYVAGTSNNDYIVVKYDSSGVQKWKRTYNGTGNSVDEAKAIAIDANNNVYVTGISKGSTTKEDYATIKYDSNGNLKWVRRYNGPANNIDGANDITVYQGSVYVTGFSGGIFQEDPGFPQQNYQLDYATIKYDTNGNQKWVRRYDGPGNGNSPDMAKSIAVDSNGNIYVTGTSFSGVYHYAVSIPPGSLTSTTTTYSNSDDFATIKYDPAGNQKWVKRYDGPGTDYTRDDLVKAIAIDSNNNVYVTGKSEGSTTGLDFTTVKYDSGGNKKWVRRYNGPSNGSDEANAIAIDSKNNIYIVGVSFGGPWVSKDDFVVVKYNPKGEKKWARRYDGPKRDYYGNPLSPSDSAAAVAIDSNDNIYVTGQSFDDVDYMGDYVTIKYDSAGNRKWVKKFNGAANKDDEAYAIAIDSNNNVYVTGESYGGSTTKNDIATVKYAP